MLVQGLHRDSSSQLPVSWMKTWFRALVFLASATEPVGPVAPFKAGCSDGSSTSYNPAQNRNCSSGPAGNNAYFPHQESFGLSFGTTEAPPDPSSPLTDAPPPLGCHGSRCPTLLLGVIVIRHHHT